jgi:hypothetical protein
MFREVGADRTIPFFQSGSLLGLKIAKTACLLIHYTASNF